MKTWRRTKSIRGIVIHTNEGPEGVNSAEALAKYLQKITGGYHWVHDSNSSLQTAPDDLCVAGARGGDANDTMLHHCVTGYSAQTRDQWLDDQSAPSIVRMATESAAHCKLYKIPIVKLAPADVAAGRSGFCGHRDITAAYRVPGGHTDPGPNFPWGEFLKHVSRHTQTVPTPAPPTPLKGYTMQLVRTLSGNGYWICSTDGGVYAYGDAPFFGSLGGQTLNAPIVGIGVRPQGDGYWLTASDGGIFSFGNAPFKGSLGGVGIAAPIQSIEVTATGNGYWLLGLDGGVFAFGDAQFYGRPGG